MTITTTSTKAVFQGNGATTTWPFTFLIPDDDSLTVTLVLLSSGDETVLAPSVYSVSGLGDAAGGVVTYPLSGSPLAATYDIVVERFVPETQQTDLVNQGGAYPADIEDALDYLTMMAQQLQDQINRSIVFSVADTVEGTLPVAAARANKNLTFDASGNPTASALVAGSVSVSAAMIPVVGATTLAAAITALDPAMATFLNAANLGAGRGTLGFFETRAAAQAVTIAASINSILLFGYTTYGDGGGAIYKRGIITSPAAFQDASGAYWGLDLSAGIVMASWFGAVGDDTTNDYTALQAGITAAQAIGGEFHLNPGKKYYVSGGDLTLAIPSGCLNFNFYGNGAQIRTNATQARTALKVQHAAAVTRADQNRKVLISGVTINHFNNAGALWGIHVVGSTHVTIRDCSFIGGSDTGVAMSVNYGSIHFVQSDIHDPNTGCFWCRIQNCDWIAGTTRIPNGIFIQGGHNALSIESNTISLCTIAIFFSQPAAGLNANDAVIANGVRILNNDFEGVNYGVYVQGTAAWSALHGLIVSNNRIEAITTVFFNYLLDTAPFSPPIIGPNYIGSGDWPPKYIASLNALYVDVRDEFVAAKTVDPASIAAGATSAFTTVTVNPATAGDHVTAESTANLLGLLLDGYVSAANTVTLRLTNGTSGAIDLGSMKFLVRVRPQY